MNKKNKFSFLKKKYEKQFLMFKSRAKNRTKKKIFTYINSSLKKKNK